MFPPTYAGAVYATEKRRLPGSPSRWSAFSSTAYRARPTGWRRRFSRLSTTRRLKIPVIEVDFTPLLSGVRSDGSMSLLDPVGRVSSLQAPHRIADAILRDSLLEGVAFRKSEIGERIGMVSRPRRHGAVRILPHSPRVRDVGLDRSERGPGCKVRASDGGRDRGHRRGLWREDQQPNRPLGIPKNVHLSTKHPTGAGQFWNRRRNRK